MVWFTVMVTSGESQHQQPISESENYYGLLTISCTTWVYFQSCKTCDELPTTDLNWLAGVPPSTVFTALVSLNKALSVDQP